MFHINRLLKKHVDGVMILLLFFIFSLTVLFFYLQNVNTHIKRYDEYIVAVLKLQNYNQEMDNTLMRSYRYLDNDKITAITKEFDKELLMLEENRIDDIFSSEVNRLLKQISLQYNLKTDLVESFKTLNARVTSTVHYLFEIQSTIDNRDNSNLQVEKLLGDVLFKIGQIFIGKDLDLLNIDQDLINLNTYRYQDDDIDYFYRHTKQMLIDIRFLNEVLNENEVLALDGTIGTLSRILEHEAKRNRETEERIGLAFFTFALIILIVLIYTYLRELKNREEISYLAYHDTLTHLPNRTEFKRYMGELIEGKYQGEKKFIVLFIDLDRFKVINDTLGHEIGDEMLITLSKRISRILGKENLLARIGGDEFVAIVENKQDIDAIDVIVAEIASVIRDPIQIKEYSLNTTASIGIAKYPDDGQTKSMLLKHADSAMYLAKDNGGDTYAFYNEQLSIRIQRRLELEQELVYALKHQEFVLYYQPQYLLDTGEITGVEVLIRWHSNVLGDVSPEEFISVAEDTGMIVELGYFVFRQACLEYMKWKKRGIELDLIAVNISSIQLRQADAFRQLKQIIEETGMPARNIEIELTERYIMEYTTEKMSIIDDLRSIGCRISIDDFGTGYSSMSYLKSLAIDTIKIDKSFIEEITTNKNDGEVAKAIILLSQSLGYEVIAEGIETLEQENVLRSYHCDKGQGYYFGKPMDSESFINFYHEQQLG
ncbi:MAG: EAL domain-containing protein [Campylobacterota bacterium]|nr:EAL domain-containing protein [Campylobacterota bacterium]